MISRDPEATVYAQIARDLREQIANGVLSAGVPVGSEKALAHYYEVGVATIRSALRILRDEGLVVGKPGQVARVAAPAEKTVQPIQRKAQISGRPATPAEAREMGIRPGAQIFVVTHRGREHKFPQDRVDLTTL